MVQGTAEVPRSGPAPFVADHLEGGGVGFVFDGVLADQSEVDRLVGASAVIPSRGESYVVSLRCRAEVAYERIKAREPGLRETGAMSIG